MEVKAAGFERQLAKFEQTADLRLGIRLQLLVDLFAHVLRVGARAMRGGAVELAPLRGEIA